MKWTIPSQEEAEAFSKAYIAAQVDYFENLPDTNDEGMAKNEKCTGRNCPIQFGKVDPETCAAEGCPWRTDMLTNADRIRAMTDEELADYHTNMCGCPPGHDPIFCGMATIGCKGCWLSWLKQEVEK